MDPDIIAKNKWTGDVIFEMMDERIKKKNITRNMRGSKKKKKKNNYTRLQF